MKARRLPGVRCSTLKTECRSLLCLMIMPGRSWVAGIDIAEKLSLYDCGCEAGGRRGRPQIPPQRRLKDYFTLTFAGKETFPMPNSSKLGGMRLSRLHSLSPRTRTRIN